jgi:membrane-bound lytic murein transglycosylase B
MFNSWRLLQIASLPALLAACAAPAAQHPITPPLRPSTASESIRIGPASPDLQEPDEASADVTPGGQLRPDIRDFAEKLAAEKGLPRDRLVSALSTARFSPTVARLIAPAPGKKVVRSWTVYRSRVVEPKRIGWGVSFWHENQALLTRASQRFGVPSTIIAAIIGVETLYGRNMGSFRVIDALTTLGFDYPDPAKPERAAMFRDQLADFLILSIGQQRVDINTSGSFAGAIGMPQFMPGSIMRYAIDGDGDGHIDLTDSVDDAVMSVGNFLMQHGWQRGLPVFAPITLSPAAQSMADGGLAPKTDWNRLHAAGATASPADANAPWMAHPLGVIDLPDDQYGTAQYRTATENFFALTQYNRSYFYAASVADLAAAISRRINE